ncbi:helix-turn-helix transcriptional regulator [Leptolyngbya sp. FACHB-321]|nr:helix-turn-helix transcriptional regulator [Leptolyngbya sp. FACHB-321]MBD2034851.1 helix-turn-helix transcriptional regulator [Leptolyngbya sp. FACHB-321]
MRENAPIRSSCPLAVDISTSPAILSKFQIDNYQFLVISLETNSSAQSSLDQSTHSSKIYIEVDRFKVQGQLYAIVRVESSSDSAGAALANLLTEREIQIATLVASGQPNKQIAKQLRISEWTVSTHLRRIFMKLGVDSRAAMVYRCAALIQQLKGQLETMQQL